MYKVKRYHDISCGHRVHGHESKCAHLHGHNYRVHFTCVADNVPPQDPTMLNHRPLKPRAKPELDEVGRVIDFSVVKERLCQWLEDNWDHKFLTWHQDPVMKAVVDACKKECPGVSTPALVSLVMVPFNPTAENMARYLVEVVGPVQLHGTGVRLTEVLIEETAKCHASYEV